MRKLRSIVFSALFFVASTASSAQEVTQSFTIDGRLYADAAATTPLTDGDVTLVFQIMNSSQNCVLYEETVPHFDASIGNGYFTLQVGSAVGTAKRSSLDSANTMAKVFSNTSPSISGRTLGGAACSYSPSAGDQRYLRVLVTPSDGVTRILSPSMSLDSVPMAVVAERAESVQGLGPSNLLQVNTSGSQVLSQSNLESIFTSSNYSALTSLLSGSSNLYSKSAANGTSVLPALSSPSSPAAGQIWYDSGAIKFYNGSSTQTLGVSGAGITSLAAGTGLNVGAGPGGTITSTGTLNVDVGTTANKIVQLDGSAKLPAVDGSQLTNLPAPASVAGSTITGTIGGSTAINTSGNITTSGNVSATNGSFSAVSTGQLSLYDSATTNTNYVTLKTPATATLTADYTLTLPAALPGSNGQVLTSDTLGNLSWSSPSTGSVTSVTSGGAPIVIGGTVSAPTVSVSAATTAASGVVTLAADGGTTASTVVQATDSRLSNSRAPNGSASGDLGGNYPSPTVVGISGKAVTYTSLTNGDFLKYNGTGWVNTALSTANLSDASSLIKSSQMPSNCSAGSTLTFSSPIGAWTCTTIPDATASTKGIMQVGTGLAVSSGTVSLASGVITTPGTYKSVTVDTYGRVTAGTNPTTAAGYGITDAFVNGGNSFGAAASLGTNDGNSLTLKTSGAAAATILSNGNVGIGTTNPSRKLHVRSDGSYQFRLENGNSGGGFWNIAQADSSFGSGGGKLIFIPDVETSTSATVVFTNSGNVGIGALSPTAKLEVSSGTANTSGVKLTNLTSASPTSTGQAIGVDASGNIVTVASAGGTVTSVTSGGAPIVIGGTAAAPTVSVSAATTAASGVVTLAADGGTTASTVVQATDSRLSNSRAPSGTAGGDLSGSYPNPTVAGISGKAVTYTSLTNGDFLKYNGTGWVNVALSTANLSDASSLIMASQMPANCAAGSTLTFSSPTNAWSCTTITGLDAGAITTGTIATARLPASATYWSSATGGISYAGGNVGVGTTAPGSPLTVNGVIESKTGGIKFPDGTVQTTAGVGGPTVSFSVNMNNVNQTVTNNAYFTPAWSTKTYDTNNFFNTATGLFTPTIAGYYQVTFSDWCYPSSRCDAYILKNGTTNSSVVCENIGGNTLNQSVVSCLVYMNGTTDYLATLGYAGGGTTLRGDTITTYFSGYLVTASTAASTGSGTAGYVPAWTSSTALGNSPIAVSGGNVGIGTAAPGELFSLNATQPQMSLTSAAASTSAITFKEGSNLKAYIQYISPTHSVGAPRSGNLEIATYSGSPEDIDIRPGDTSAIYAKAGGNVGIGTTSPNGKLDIGLGNDNIAFYQPSDNALAIQAYIDGHWSDRSTYASPGSNVLALQPTAGFVGIGTVSPGAKLDVQGGVTNSSGGYTQTSDIRLKTNVEYLKSDDALAKVLNLRGIYYDWKDPEKYGNEHQIGVIAQDVQKVFPEAVRTNSEGTLSVSYPNLVAPIIESIKELYRRIVGQDREIASLSERASKLEAENSLLKAKDQARDQEIQKLMRENAETKARLDKFEKMLKSK